MLSTFLVLLVLHNQMNLCRSMNYGEIRIRVLVFSSFLWMLPVTDHIELNIIVLILDIKKKKNS